MVIPSYEEAKNYHGTYTMIPVCKEFMADVITPILLLQKMLQMDEQVFLLESVEGGEQFGRYSFLGFHPRLHVYAKGGKVVKEHNNEMEEVEGDPYEELRNLLKEYHSPRIKELPNFSGGFVGYFSYEMLQCAEPKLQLKTSNYPDYDLMMYDRIIAYDHLKQKLLIIANYLTKEEEKGYQEALYEIERIRRKIEEAELPQKEKTKEDIVFTSNVSREKFCHMVEQTKQYIREGDIFQAVISRRFEAEYHGSLLNTYRILRTTNPSPYMYFIQNKDLQIAGTSPETMVKLENGRITTFPVAGTRRRGKDEAEDLALERELLQDEKELSEHNMLVDLARNDVGKVSRYGTVQVKEYMNIHRFSKVMHISSVVQGELQSGKDVCDTIAAILPAGTLSGAPKFRAAQIINELEDTARGIYGGAIGYVDLSGNMDLCIAIRTAIKKDNRVYVQAGAGIVADSVPELEYEETKNKAGAVIEAVCLSGEVEEE